MSTTLFNLCDEPWIKARHVNGSVEELGLIELFRRFEEFDDLAGESATQNQAMFRLLQAILVHALRRLEAFEPDADPAATWAEIQRFDGLGQDVANYLTERRDRFNLFDPKAPFLQVADLTTKKGEFPNASVLVPDVGPGLFSTSTQDSSASLSPDQAARWLVYTQAYDVSGIKSGAVGDPRVKGGRGYPIGTGWAGAIGSVQLMGPSLRDTLVLNLPMDSGVLANYETQNLDLPPWEREPDGAAPRSEDDVMPRGVVDVLTWQQRRIRLIPSADATRVDGALVCNGDKIQRANQFIDPTTGYRYSTAQSKRGLEVHFPKTHNPDLTVWRGVQSILGGAPGDTKGKDRTARVIQQVTDAALGEAMVTAYPGHSSMIRITGISYGTQDAVVDSEISETLPIRLQLLTEQAEYLRDLVLDVIERVLRFRFDMGIFHRRLLISAGASPVESPAAPVAAWLAAVETEFLAWLESLDTSTAADVVAAQHAWTRRIQRVTRLYVAEAVIAAGPRAARGRIEETEKGNVILHSSAADEVWILSMLRERFPEPHPA